MIRLKSKNLRKLINEVVFRGRDFDTCLFEALLIEDGGTIVKMAMRGARNNVVVDHTSDGEDYVIVARKNDAGDLEAKAAAIGSSEGGWWRLKYLYSNEPRTSVTPLAILAALARFKKIIPDIDVSPEAEKFIKPYYESNVGSDGVPNPELIEPDADAERVKKNQDQNKPWLRAGYYLPSGTESSIYKVKWEGDNAVEEMAEKTGKSPEDIKDMLANSARSGFSAAYDSERTGISKVPEEVAKDLGQATARKDLNAIAIKLYTAYKDHMESPQKNKKKTWIPTWIKTNQNELAAAVAKNPDGKNAAYLDNLISKIIEREEGVPGYSILSLATS